MNIEFKNDVTNISKIVEFDPKKIAEKYLEENKEKQTEVINDLSFGGFYDEDLFAYVESILDNRIANGLGMHPKHYTYDYDDCVKLVEAIKDCIIH